MESKKKLQKTIYSFFDKQQDKNANKMCCYCNKLIPVTKLSWHKDYLCTKKPNHMRNIIPSKGIKWKTKLQQNLSDSDSSDIVILENEDTNQNSARLRSRSSSPELFDLKQCNDKENAKDLHKPKLVDLIISDWDSPEKSPLKTSLISYENDKNISPSFSLLSNTDSDEDFEDKNVTFVSQTPPKEKKKVNKKSPIKTILQGNIEAGTSPLTANLEESSNERKDPSTENDRSNTKSKFDTVIASAVVEAVFSDSSNQSFEEFQNPQDLVSPTRTPTPSPCTSSTQKSKVIEMSPYISSTPQKFNVKKKLIDIMNDSDEDMATLSQNCLSQVSSKITPPNVKSQLRKMNLPTSCAPKINVQKNLFLSDNQIKNSPSKSVDKSPYKYRKDKGMYLYNFEHILNIVRSEPDNLLLFNDFDTDVIKTWYQLSLEAQKLYVRLFQRKLKWNKVSKIEYKDICDKEDIILYINELVYADFLFSESKLTGLEDMLTLLDFNDLKKLSKEMKLRVSGTKENVIKSLLKCNKSQKTISQFCKAEVVESQIMKKAKEYMGKCFLVNKEVWSVFMRILHLYCPMNFDEDEESGHQSQLTALLMLSIGKMRFPSYQIIRDHLIYRTREDLVRFQMFMQLEYEIQDFMKYQNWDDAIKTYKEVEEKFLIIENERDLWNHDASLPLFLRRYTTLSFISHIRGLAVEIYQRQRHYGKAVKLLEKLLSQKSHRQDCRGRWYDRLALNLHQHLKKPAKALQVIKEAMEDPDVRVGHKLSLSLRAERILNSKIAQKQGKNYPDVELMKFQEAPKICIQGKSLPSDIAGFKRIYLSSELDNENNTMCCSVEELVLSHYKREGYPKGLHSEGRVINSLFGFFFWDILYLSVPDAFRTQHQSVPLDLDSPEFYTRRKEEIDKRLSEMVNWTLTETTEKVSEVWSENIDCVSIIDWNLFSSLDYLMGLIEGLGLNLISAICERLAKDHRFTRSGFPDLIVWDPVNKLSRIVEVKGPNDKLSTKQILWLDFLLCKGASAEVCHVEAVGQKRNTSLISKKISPQKRSSSRLNRQEMSEVSEKPSAPTDLQTEKDEEKLEFQGKIKKGTKRKRKA